MTERKRLKRRDSDTLYQAMVDMLHSKGLTMPSELDDIVDMLNGKKQHVDIAMTMIKVDALLYPHFTPKEVVEELETMGYRP